MIIDEIDSQIIALLKEAPRSTHRSLAQAMQLSEPNVAARVSRLEELGILRVMAVVDMHAVGYEHVAVFGIRIADRYPDDVAADLVDLPETMSVNCTFGRFQLVCILLARDKQHLTELLDQRIGAIPGVQDLESCLVLDVRLMRCDLGKLSLFKDQKLSHLPDDHTIFDELDLGVIEALQENGRMSFREVGRRLSAPEATVRSRIGRLEQLGAVRVVAVTDTDSLMPGIAPAWIALSVRGGALDAVASRLCKVAEAYVVLTAIGRFNVVALLALPSRQELLDLVTRSIAPLRGVQQLEIWEIVRSYKHDLRITTRLF